MNFFKNKDTLINIISTVIISGVVMYFVYKKDNSYKDQTSPQNLFQIQSNYNKSKIAYTETTNPEELIYNYNNLLILIDKTRELKLNFYSNFEKFIKNSENIKELEDTLTQLKAERSFYKKYLKQANVYHKRSEPSKQRNSLRYYLRVLEDNIDDIKKMMTRFNLSYATQVFKNL
ncbi:MAG: hypothetical protein SZ59_C0003G0088 [candidate division TM6 bacterium GW2011_GWF2_28_16]|jgi:hypothetical protein|nr:MAG: hypothetical protein SZ59_C0003G0088 [candidate division TM6 bacterium GW2011_GWF2_28_16]